jgi:biotin carboxyl carrier protein
VKLKITVEGRAYEVDVEVTDAEQEGPSYYPPLFARTPAAAPPSAAPRRGAAPPSGGPDDGKVCRSPLAGTIARVNAQVGQAIQVNDQLLVLEAMKMETVITAPFEGRIRAVNAAVGDAVTQGQVLVEIE